MERPQLIRRCRIVASLFFALSAVALCLLWLRSHSVADTIVLAHSPGRCTVVDSMFGKIYLGFYGGTTKFKISSFPLRGVKFFDLGNSTLSLPHWCLALALIAISVLLAWPTRFSLRTLLITTTFVALALGIGVWLAS